MKCTVSILFAAGAGLFFPCAVTATDWPAYRGPSGDGISSEKILLKWPSGGPKQLWKVETPRGFSSFTVSQGKALTVVQRTIEGAPREVCLALDANTGLEVWAANIGPAKYDGGGDDGAPDNRGGDGPRSTPTVNDGKVYLFTPFLVLHCLEAATGKTVWTKDVMREHQGRNIGWKSAMSPVVDGVLVFVGGGGPGQSLLGINKNSGQVVWKAQDESITHATPVAATIQGVRQVIFFVQSGLLAVDASNGAALWRFPFRYNVSTASSPVVAGDIVYCSAGYGVGGGACRIIKAGDKFSATELWKIPGDKQVANHWSTPVYKDGHLYGMFSFKKYASGPLKCVELATGKVKWEQAGFGAGQVILVDGHIVALTDNGEVAVVEATPDGYKEVSRAKVVQGKCWSTPSLSGGHLLVRSTKEGVCLDLSPTL
jgi:outer membrane protein assembly factor BamB